MCGIFGCVGEISEKEANECIKRIAHRGPNALQTKRLDGVTLSHARLSILDTSELANQPMADESERYWLVYNGEIYNYLEIRKELESLGYTFRTNGDTEVVLYAYIHWGSEFQNKCNGMWSIAIWDSYKKELFLSRDRFGIKPFYYYEQDGNFYFASEMKAFFPIMKQRRINYQVLEKKNYFFWEATQECSIKHIKKVPAGYNGSLKNGKLTLKKWWCTLDHLVNVPEIYEEQVERLRELFLDACKIRMRSDVPIGTALSGGVDSSAVVGAMKYISQNGAQYVNKDWQHVFVASMPNTIIDETEFAEKAADYIGVSIDKVRITSKIPIDDLFGYLYMCEEPYITSPIPFMQTYGYISNKGVRVTVDGHGADELFGGYPHDIFYSLEDISEKEKQEELWKTYNAMSIEESRISRDEFLKLVSDFPSIDTYIRHGAWQQMDNMNKHLYLQTHTLTLPTLLRCYDRYSMSNGVEIRMPFMDYRIVCFALSIPWNSKVNGGYTKKIVRDMAAPFMDNDIIYRKSKIGFNSPISEWLEGDMKEFISDTIHAKEFIECELVNSLEVNIMVDEFYKHKTHTYGEGELIWMRMVPYFWKKAMGL